MDGEFRTLRPAPPPSLVISRVHMHRSNCSDISWVPNAPSSSSPSSPSSPSGPAERLVPLRSVTLSAIATDASGRPCLYLQIDDGLSNGELSNGELSNGEHAEDPLEVLSEMYLVFSSTDDLHKAFEAMCQGALRNPDSDDEDGDNDDNEDGQAGGAGLGGWFTAGSLAEGLEANVLADGDGDSDRGDASA
jgi:hypothetical protein